MSLSKKVEQLQEYAERRRKEAENWKANYKAIKRTLDHERSKSRVVEVQNNFGDQLLIDMNRKLEMDHAILRTDYNLLLDRLRESERARDDMVDGVRDVMRRYGDEG
jgi:hypothetical protein